MKRREFGKVVSTAGAASLGLPASASAAPARGAKRNTLMHVGGDYHSVAGSGITSKENLEYNLGTASSISPLK